MPSSIINSDDGVISGTSGLKSSGGDDGVLVFQSKGTETARINTDKQIVAAAGTASLPIYSTTGDLNTGIYFPAADNIGFATNGVIRGRWTNDGLCFNADTAAANALDDYEEGTFTPAIVGSTTAGTGTYSVQVGNYTKIGNTVSVRVFLVWSAHTGTGNMSISGLPFTSNSNSWSAGACRVVDLSLSANNVIQAGVSISTTTIFLEQISTGGGGYAPVPMDTNAQIMFTTQYIV